MAQMIEGKTPTKEAKEEEEKEQVKNTWWQRRSLEEAQKLISQMNIPQKQEVLNSIEEKAKDMRRKEQETKPLAVRHQQVAEAIRTQHARL
eukprot:7060252-Prorocentrum_lima.AAC.1